MEDTHHYRAVILAAPFHSTDITLSPSSLQTSIPPQPYVRLHVTLLSTPTSSAHPSYFGLGAKDTVPRTILTTGEGFRRGKDRPEFNSMTFHGKVRRHDGEMRDVEEHLVKVFSQRRVEDAWLEEVFGLGQVTWIHRHEVRYMYPLCFMLLAD